MPNKRKKSKYEYEVIIQMKFTGMGSNQKEAIDFVIGSSGSIELHDYPHTVKNVRRTSKPLSQEDINRWEEHYKFRESY